MTRLAIISDTHGRHEAVRVPDCDILIHCGDYTNRGMPHEYIGFIEWFEKQPAKNKILIEGNHDLHSDSTRTTKENWKNFKGIKEEHKGITFLENSAIEINGIKFWGSPITPWFFGEYWAHNKRRGEEIRKVWDEIPKDTDILITHGPPMGVLDAVMSPYDLTEEHVGCEELGKIIQSIKPKIHCFGHLHLSGGQTLRGDNTLYVNAAICDEEYKATRKPITIDI